MTNHKENIPDPKEIEKEISEFLAKKFKNNVKVVSPVVLPKDMSLEKTDKDPNNKKKINFDLLPEDLVSYLDQYIVKQDSAKAILATKICTHFNRIKHTQNTADKPSTMVGSIKNNVLMLGPTGVGKTYIIKLIADKIGVPFVKGDATKFSETGYVGGDVEDLIRDLVREAEDDIELAQYGIVYIDEIDKIAGSRNHLGADVSRTGVQRALLKPMEETEVDLKVPHDPISMIQEIERYRKTGKRDKRSVNTKNILFIMSGAFSELADIIRKRLRSQEIGFSAQISTGTEAADILQQVKSEDLIKYGFESEFVGRLPVRAVFEQLSENDLYHILKNPNNPIILGKKLDFAAYGIQIKFDDTALKLLAKQAYEENTGARGLVSAVEKALLPFEQKLPSTDVRLFPVTSEVVEESENSLSALTGDEDPSKTGKRFQRLVEQEHNDVKAYIQKSTHHLAEKYKLTMTPARIDILANCYTKQIIDIEQVIKKIRNYYDSVKKIELYFFKNHDINIVLEEDAIDYIIDKLVDGEIIIDHLYPQLCQQFEHGLKLVREKTGQHRYFITRQALVDPESFIGNLLKRPKRSL